jgi:hypothetical protein
LPFTPGGNASRIDNAGGSGNIGNVPNRICDGSIASPSVAKWFEPKCFVTGSTNVYGNSGINILRGPRYQNWDFSLKKDFHLWSEARYLQFRGEFLDAFNHPNFGRPVTDVTSSQAGQITSLAGQANGLLSRQIQLGLKFYF